MSFDYDTEYLDIYNLESVSQRRSALEAEVAVRENESLIDPDEYFDEELDAEALDRYYSDELMGAEQGLDSDVIDDYDMIEEESIGSKSKDYVDGRQRASGFSISQTIPSKNTVRRVPGNSEVFWSEVNPAAIWSKKPNQIIRYVDMFGNTREGALPYGYTISGTYVDSAGANASTISVPVIINKETGEEFLFDFDGTLSPVKKVQEKVALYRQEQEELEMKVATATSSYWETRVAASDPVNLEKINLERKEAVKFAERELAKLEKRATHKDDIEKGMLLIRRYQEAVKSENWQDARIIAADNNLIKYVELDLRLRKTIENNQPLTAEDIDRVLSEKIDNFPVSNEAWELAEDVEEIPADLTFNDIVKKGIAAEEGKKPIRFAVYYKVSSKYDEDGNPLHEIQLIVNKQELDSFGENAKLISSSEFPLTTWTLDNAAMRNLSFKARNFKGVNPFQYSEQGFTPNDYFFNGIGKEDGATYVFAHEANLFGQRRSDFLRVLSYEKAKQKWEQELFAITKLKVELKSEGRDLPPSAQKDYDRIISQSPYYLND
jgi:hypothetical protein